MSDTFRQVQDLIRRREVIVSQHGYDEMLQDGIQELDPIKGMFEGVIVEDYPDHVRGPCVLVLQRDRDRQPIHVVWGIKKNTQGPAVLVTA